jgi:transketolase
MRQQFKNTVTALAAYNDRIVMLLGDVSVYLFKDFKEIYPDRFYNIGICENTLISVGAGLSSQGFYPVVHTIAPFITERSFEQIKLDMCYNQFGGNIVSCGASFDYAWDGATHHAYTDLALLRLLPDMEVMQPGSVKEVDVLIRSQYNNGHPSYFRLSDNPHNIDIPVTFGKAVVLKNTNSPVTVMTAGPILGNVFEACRQLDVNLVYFHTIKPIDREIIEAFGHTTIVVVHDAFGLYEAVCEVPGLTVFPYGFQGQFYCSYGTIEDARKCLGLDSLTINKTIQKYIAEHHNSRVANVL